MDVTVSGMKTPAHRIARLKEQRDQLMAHVKELEDKIYIIENEMREHELQL